MLHAAQTLRSAGGVARQLRHATTMSTTVRAAPHAAAPVDECRCAVAAAAAACGGAGAAFMHTRALVLDAERGGSSSYNNYSSNKAPRREGGSNSGGAPSSAWSRGQQARRDSSRLHRRRAAFDEQGELEAREEQQYEERRPTRFQQQRQGQWDGDRRSGWNGAGARDQADDAAPSEHEQRVVQAAAGKWYELEFVYGGPTRPFAILHKPAGLSVQGRYHSDSVDKRLRLGYGAKEVYFPHRLDKHTCGLLVVAFSRAASKALGASMEQGRWEKKYRVMTLVPPAVDMEYKPDAQAQPLQEGADGATASADALPSSTAAAAAAPAPPVLPFTTKFPSHTYPASALLSPYLVGSLWGTDALQPPAAAQPGKGRSTDLAGARTPVRIFLRQQATLRSYLARRPLPLYKRIDEANEWAKWNRAIQPLPANRAQLSSSSPTDAAACTGAFVASSPSKDGSAGIDRRRLHPFVPETMLYESVPFRPVEAPVGGGAVQKHRARKDERSTDEDDVDEAELDAAEIAAAAASAADPTSASSSAVSTDVPKKSVTEFTLLSSNPALRLALWDVVLVTGRSHQIRIHCADAGVPVVNDPYYNQYSVYGWMREAARLRAEDALAKQVRAQGRQRGPLTTEAAAHAVEQATLLGETLPLAFPAPTLEPMRPPALPVRTGALPQTLRSGTRVSLSRGTIAPTNKRGDHTGRSNKNPALERQEHRKHGGGGGGNPDKRAGRAKYGGRAPRQTRAFATASRALLARVGPLLAESSYTSTSTSSRSSRGARRGQARPSSSSRGADGPEADAQEDDGTVLRRGRSSVGQGGGVSGEGRSRGSDAPNEHEEFDDESERRVIRPRGAPAAAAGEQSRPHEQRQAKPSRPSGPRVPAWQRAQDAARASEDEHVQFEHHVSYGGRKKPVKPRKEEDENGAQNQQQRQQGGAAAGGKAGTSVRYTNRHDAPKRPHWLPEHVPYRLVAPNPAVQKQWGSVLGSYGVTTAGDKDAQADEDERLKREQEQSVQPFTAAKRYEGVERGAGAVGWLVKPAESSVSLAEPTPATAGDAAASGASSSGDNQWFSTQVSRPEHEMTLQAYYLRIPHPFKQDEIITCTQALPRHWEKLLQSGEQDDKKTRK